MTAISENPGHLTGGGQFVVDLSGSADLPAPPYQVLSGSTVSVTTPSGLPPTGLSQHVILTDGHYNVGFQACPKGLGLWALGPTGFSAELTGTLTVRGGLLGHYELLAGNDVVTHFTLWQGETSDVYTFDHARIDDAMALLSALETTDTVSGPRFDVRAPWRTVNESLTVAIGDYVLETRPVALAPVPPWVGTPGTYGDFYSLGDDPHHGLLFISDSAHASVKQFREDGGGSLDLDTPAFVAELAIHWREPARIRNDLTRGIV